MPEELFDNDPTFHFFSKLCTFESLNSDKILIFNLKFLLSFFKKVVLDWGKNPLNFFLYLKKNETSN